MDLAAALAIVVAGFAAGAVNGVVGAGTLITYPVLLAVGASPVTANATNTTGLSVGSWTSAWAYRRELAGRRRVLLPAFIAGVLGAALGASLVLALPERVFATLVPWLILLGAVLVGVQPWLQPLLRRRRGATAPGGEPRRGALTIGIGGIGIYGGYFGGGQGVVLMALLGWVYDPDPQRSNAAKNLFAAAANVTAAVVFIVAGRVWWWAAVVLAIGAALGGTVGAQAARRLAPGRLRLAVVAVGIIAAVAAWLLR